MGMLGVYTIIGLAMASRVQTEKRWRSALIEHLSRDAHPVTNMLPLKFCARFVLTTVALWPIFLAAEIAEINRGR